MFARYHAALERMLSYNNLEKTSAYASPDTATNALKRTRQMLKRLGNPEKALRFIHVTGTSGKGSVTNMMHEILRANGEKVASYSSPHTTTYLERFRIDDKLPHPDALAQALEDVCHAYEDHLRAGLEPLAFADLNVCIAFLLFQREGAEWCVLEVAMGGRWDSTNVIPSPAVAIITNVDFDHVEPLGDTKKSIAQHKAGIIKPRTIAITGETAAEPLLVIRREAKKQRAPLFIIPNGSKDHRQHNADICRAAARALHIPDTITEKAILAYKPLPCRLELIQDAPRVIIDGAHNAAKIQATVAYMQKQKATGRTHIVFGYKGSKDGKHMAKALAKIADTVRTTRFVGGHGRAANPGKILTYFPKKLQRKAFFFPLEALQDVLKEAKKEDTILITGSLYLAGEMRTHWRPEEVILKERQS